MSTDSIPSRNKGLILPVALILMAFGTTMILTAGIMLQRSSKTLNDYSLLSDLRVATNNLIEGAAMTLASKWSSASFESQWDGYDDFRDFVSARGGYEGILWEEAIDTLAADNWWLVNEDTDFQAILDDTAFEGLTNKGAAINHTDDKYSIVSWAEKGGVKRYSYGLAMTESLIGLSALTMGELSRVFYEITTVDGELSEDFGDLINGAATIFSEVLIHGTDETLTRIFPFGLIAESVSASPSDESIEFESFTATDATNKDAYFEGLLAEFEQWIDTLTREASYLSISSANSHTPDATDLLYVFGSQTSNSTYILDFPDAAYNPDKPNQEYRYVDVRRIDDNNSITIYSKGYPVNLLIYGDVIVQGNAQQISFVNGRYDVTAYGDISVQTNLLYGDFSTEFASATGNKGGTLTKPIETWTSIKSLLTEFSNRPEGDHVVFKALGGDIFNYLVQGGSGTATHGIRALAGDYYALENGDEGGSFVFPDMEDLQNIMNGQLYIFGSLTGNRFDPLDQLRNIYNLFVSSPQNTDGGYSTTRRLVLMGLRAW